MRQGVAAIGIGCFVLMVQGCAAPGQQVGHETVAITDGNRVSRVDDDFLRKVEQHVERQDRPGSTLMFR